MIEIGIPNLSTPAAIIDRIIIEKLKVEEFRQKEQTDLIDTTLCAIHLLNKQLDKIFKQFPIKGDLTLIGEFFTKYNNLVIMLTIAVGQVSYFENQKALEHKKNEKKDTAYIAHMDQVSRQYNEQRSLYKKQLDLLFEECLNIRSTQETRTF